MYRLPRRYSAFGVHLFSLVELVLVISLMMLMIAMTLPSLKGILRANSVNVGASMLAQEVRLARQRAVASGKHIAILMPTAESDDDGGFSDPNYKASAFRSCYLSGEPTVVNTADGSYYEGEWNGYLPDSQWKYLPSGVFIGYTESFGPHSSTVTVVTLTPFGNNVSPASKTIGPSSCNVVTNLNFPESSGGDTITNLRALIFRPDGTALPAPDNGNTLVIVQSGYIRDGNSLILSGDISKNMVGFRVNRFTGKLKFF